MLYVTLAKGSIAKSLQPLIELKEKEVTNVLFVIISVLFLFAFLRMLYQWLVASGVKLPAVIGQCLLIKEVQPAGPAQNHEESFKKGLRTTLIIFAVALLSRFLVYGLAYIFRLEHDMSYGAKPYGFFDRFMDAWNQWDAPHYLDIAVDWYVGDTNVHNHLFIVFYPLYPLLMRICAIFAPSYLYPGFEVSTLQPISFSDSGGYFFYWGCIISVICLCVAAVYFYKLARFEFSKNVALWALAFLLFNPANFFLNTAYTESLFLLLTIMCFYYLRKGSYIVAAIAGALAAFTRSLGVLLAFPFFFEWFAQEGIADKLRQKQFKAVFFALAKKGLPVLIIPVGTAAYLLINYFTFGDALKFMEIQSNHWHQNFMFFIENIANLGTRSLFYDINTAMQIWLPGFLMIMVALIAFLTGSGKGIRTSYLAYMMVYLVVGAAPSWLLSGCRYFAMLFPIYLVMARSAEKNKIWGAVMLILSIAAFLYLMAMYITGRQVM